MIDMHRTSQTVRRLLWAAPLLLVLLLPACMGDDDANPTETVSTPASPSATSAASVTTARPAPSLPAALLTPTASPTAVPAPTATATFPSGTPSATSEPVPIPAGQEEDLPAVELAYAIDRKSVV